MDLCLVLVPTRGVVELLCLSAGGRVGVSTGLVRSVTGVRSSVSPGSDDS